MPENEQKGALARSVDVIYNVTALAAMCVLLWRYVDPDADPREVLARFVAPLRERWEARRALWRTLREIEELPERGDQ